MKKINYPATRAPKGLPYKRKSALYIEAYLLKHRNHSPAEALQIDCLESLSCIKSIEVGGKVEANRLKAAMFLVDKVLGNKVITEFKADNITEVIQSLYGLTKPLKESSKAVKRLK